MYNGTSEGGKIIRGSNASRDIMIAFVVKHYCVYVVM